MNEQEPKDAEVSVIPGRNATETEIKHSAALILHDAGMSNEAIAKTINRHPVTICNTLKKMKRESFSHPRRVKAAAKTLDAIMSGFHGEVKEKVDGSGAKVLDSKGNPVTELVIDERVKASDALRAVEIIGKASGEIGADQSSAAPQQSFTQITVNAQYFQGGSK